MYFNFKLILFKNDKDKALDDIDKQSTDITPSMRSAMLKEQVIYKYHNITVYGIVVQHCI